MRTTDCSNKKNSCERLNSSKSLKGPTGDVDASNMELLSSKQGCVP